MRMLVAWVTFLTFALFKVSSRVGNLPTAQIYKTF